MHFIVKNTTLPNFLDLLAPHTCRGCSTIGQPLCDKCKNYIISHHQDYCPICKKPKTTLLCPNCNSKNTIPTFVVSTRDSLVGTLIHDLKYNSTRALARPLAEILHATLPDLPGQVIIVPLPTSSAHVRARGLDHTLLIAKHLASIRGKNYHVEQLLIRSKNTTQVGTDQKTRLSQAASAYEISKNATIDKNATYLLLDDVWTTGASMDSALKKIVSLGVSNLLLTVLAINSLD